MELLGFEQVFGTKPCVLSTLFYSFTLNLLNFEGYATQTICEAATGQKQRSLSFNGENKARLVTVLQKSKAICVL
jgi:hypothetical protein